MFKLSPIGEVLANKEKGHIGGGLFGYDQK